MESISDNMGRLPRSGTEAEKKGSSLSIREKQQFVRRSSTRLKEKKDAMKRVLGSSTRLNSRNKNHEIEVELSSGRSKISTNAVVCQPQKITIEPKPFVSVSREEHEANLKTIRGILSDCTEQYKKRDKYKLIILVSYKDGVFGSHHNWATIHLSMCYKPWFSRINYKSGMGWIYDTQLDLWASYLHECIAQSNNNRIQFISASVLDLKAVAADARVLKNEARIETFFKIMTERPARIYVCPFSRDDHWLLLLVVPESSRVYCIDSKAWGIKDHDTLCVSFVRGIERLYHTQASDVSSVDHKTWKIKNITHKLQDDCWECGYYVMRYMEKVALETDGIKIKTVFPKDESPYTREELDTIAHKWCRIFKEEMFPINYIN